MVYVRMFNIFLKDDIFQKRGYPPYDIEHHVRKVAKGPARTRLDNVVNKIQKD